MADNASIQNLVANGDFAATGGEFGAANWWPWCYEEPRPADGSPNYAYRPNWNIESLSKGAAARFIRSGDSALRIINNWDPWHAGVVQVVNAPAGSRVQLTAYGQLWTAYDGYPAQSVPDCPAHLQAGIEPNGNNDFHLGSIVWSSRATPHNTWEAISVEATVGPSGRVAVFLSANMRGFSRLWLGAFWDDVSLTVMSAVPTVSPTPTVTTPTGTTTVTVPPGPETPKPKNVLNLLMNGGFEEGVAYFSDGTRERAVPAGWLMSFHDSSTPNLPGQTAPFGKPITALINSRAVADSDRARVFAGGVYCWKICGTTSPVWVRLTQALTGLKAGQLYRFSVNLLPDLIVRTHPQIAYAGDPLSGEVLLTADCAEKTFESGWKSGTAAPFGRYTRLTLDFTTPSSQVEVAVEVRGRWALPSGAWYIDELSLAPA